MPTTSNFGWTTPADTDLVKDGAAAIRTLGNGIDTSLVDLKGGTTGQVLSKASNTDLDFSWVAQDDSNAIQNALLTTTGDTIYASGASTPARLGIGTTGQVLTVAGGVPSWATPTSGGFTLISTTNMAGSGNFNVSSIPTSYKHLLFVLRNCYASGGGGNDFNYRFNSDSGNNYNSFGSFISGSGVSFNGNRAGTNAKWGQIQSESATMRLGNGSLWIYDYNSTAQKTGFSTFIADTSTELRVYQFAVTYGGSSGITSANFLFSSTFTTGTLLTYGVS